MEAKEKAEELIKKLGSRKNAKTCVEEILNGLELLFNITTISNQQDNCVSTKDDKILYWAKQLEYKSMSLNELVENAKWLLDHV